VKQKKNGSRGKSPAVRLLRKGAGFRGVSEAVERVLSATRKQERSRAKIDGRVGSPRKPSGGLARGKSNLVTILRPSGSELS